jgi:hypothetical protein
MRLYPRFKISKSEARNPPLRASAGTKQIPNSNEQKLKTKSSDPDRAVLKIGAFVIRACFGFRDSDFGFRISVAPCIMLDVAAGRSRATAELSSAGNPGSPAMIIAGGTPDVMTQPDKHDQSADALKAMADGEPKPQASTDDGFVGADPPDESEDGVAGGGDEPSAAVLSAGGAPAGPQEVPLVADFAPDPAMRRSHTAAFNQRERLAHAHQYKTIMIPLLLTLGVILLLMGAYALSRGGTVEVEIDGVIQVMPISPVLRWFPLMALPLGAILLAGAWLFHRDTSRKRR